MNGLSRTVALLALVGLAALPAPPAAAQTARASYAAARAREDALRQGAGTLNRAPTLAQYRAVIAAYESVSRRFPATGYADNALWQAALLSLDAFDRFGQERERRTARRLLQGLVDRYPSSSLSARGRVELDRLIAASRPAGSAPPGSNAAPSPAADPAGGAPPQAAAGLVEIRQIRRTVTGDGVRVTIEIEREVNFHTERVENPPRLLFDLAGTRPGKSLVEGTLTYPDGIVRHVRVGRHPNDVTRVVLDLTGASRHSTFTLYDPYRIVIDCEAERPVPIPSQRITEDPLAPPVPDPAPPGRASASAPQVTAAVTGATPSPFPPPAKKPPIPRPTPIPAPRSPLSASRLPQTYTRLGFAVGWTSDELWPPLAGRRVGPSWAVLPAFRAADLAALLAALTPTLPPSKPASSTTAASSPATPAAVPPKPPPVVSPATPAPLVGGFSLARQLGLGVSRVVIDPGHGGHDPGALGPGITEAAVVLDVAVRLEKLLKAAGVEVVLTRRKDVFLPLEERTRLANAAEGDLFLSIHANASRNRNAQGVESYVLNFASNPDAEAVAARENAASAGTMSNLTGIVRAITLNNKLDESRGLAASVQAQLVKKLKGAGQPARAIGVKQAPFVVLIGAGMPSVLVEVSFITHRQEGRLLKTAAYRQRIAEGLFEGIRGYQRSLKRADATTGR